MLEKVRDEAVKDVTVSEEELQEAYNTHVESAMTTYGNSPSAMAPTCRMARPSTMCLPATAMSSTF